MWVDGSEAIGYARFLDTLFELIAEPVDPAAIGTPAEKWMYRASRLISRNTRGRDKLHELNFEHMRWQREVEQKKMEKLAPRTLNREQEMALFARLQAGNQQSSQLMVPCAPHAR